MPARRAFAALMSAALCAGISLASTGSASAQPVRVKDIARVQGVTNNQLVGYGIVTGLNGTGDSTQVIFTSQTIQNILQSFGISTTIQNVRTRNVAAVTVTALLPPFAHSGDTADVVVSSMGDATSLQGGTLVMTELKAANNLVYATAQGPISVGGFYAGGNTQQAGQNTISVNFTGAGRVPQGAIIARDMVTPLRTDQSGFTYVLTNPDYATAARLQNTLNEKFGSIANALDAEAVHVNLPPAYSGNQVQFLADAGQARDQRRPHRPRRAQRADRNGRHGRRYHPGAVRDRPREPLGDDFDPKPGRAARPVHQRPGAQPAQHDRPGDRVRPQAPLYLRSADSGPSGPGPERPRSLASRPDRDHPDPTLVRLPASRRGDQLVDILVGAATVPTTVASTLVVKKPTAPLTAQQQQALSRLHQVSQQWEGVFVGMLFKEMRKGESDETVFGEKSNGEKIFGEMLDQQYADTMAKTGSLGLGKLLESQMRPAVLANAAHESTAPIPKVGGL